MKAVFRSGVAAPYDDTQKLMCAHQAYEMKPTRPFSELRYENMIYRKCGKWGLKLPAISLGAWETFGGYRGEETAPE